MGHLDARAHHEELGRQVRARADAGRAVVQHAGLFLGEPDHVLEGLGRQVVAHDHDVLEGARAGQGREVRHHVVARLLKHELVVAVGLVGAEGDGEAVGPGLGHDARADRAGAARDVVDHDLLAERSRDVGRHDARDHVDRAAGRIGHDQAHRRRRRPALCESGPGERRSQESCGENSTLHYLSPFSSMIVLAMTASWSHGNRIQVSWLTSVM